MLKSKCVAGVFTLLWTMGIALGEAEKQSTVALASLDVTRATQTWGPPGRDSSVAGAPLIIAGQRFDRGFGTHATSRLNVRLLGRADSFGATVGVDDGAGRGGSVEFNVIGDNKTLFSSGVMRSGQPPKTFDVDLRGVQYLTLEVTDAGDGLASDHADWVNARFEGVSGAIQTVERLPDDFTKVVPGAPWRDTDGNLIQAHGGNIMFHEGQYYWYGEDRSEGYVAIGVSAYVSRDLVTWKRLGVVLPSSAYDEKWKELTINERPKVVFNPRTKKFVMWFHYDRSAYWDSQAGVAVADAPQGPFTFLGMHRPNPRSTYRDMNLFVDDDGQAYSIYAGDENYTMYIVRLNEDWTAPEQPMMEGKTWIRTLVRGHREAPAPFKHDGRYYMITSAATGWAPNRANYAVADSMLGEWKVVGDPCVGAAGDTTFGSQSTSVLPVPNKPGTFIYMGDRWRQENLADARYVWLPFEVKPDGKIEIKWVDRWEPKDFGFPAADKELAQSSYRVSDEFPKRPADFADRPLSYQLHNSAQTWPVEQRNRIIDAMDDAAKVFNTHGDFPKSLHVTYRPSSATTDSTYSGNIRFGTQISRMNAMEQIARALGVATHPKWSSFIKDGRWTGEHAVAQLREWDGSDAVLHADANGFWPYGFRAEKQLNPKNEHRQVLMVSAIRKDLGITNQPIVGMVGVGTYRTVAEFKDFKVTKGDQVLFESDFTQGLQNWKTTRGRWEVRDGALRQSSSQTNVTAVAGDASWSDYTLTLKARKISGEEGFLILFGASADDTQIRWNLGGWGNARHGIQMPDSVTKSKEGRIETGRWYDIKVVVQGPSVECYLDGELVQTAKR